MQDLGIDVIRSFLIAPAGRSSARGRGKVFIVLDADLMSVAAQNALLKTLEEPPAGVTILLIAQQSEQMLPTPLSRCALIRFSLLPRQWVQDKLTGQSVPAAEAKFWANFTAGSIGRAMELSQRGLYPVKRKIVEDLAALGSGGGETDLGEKFSKIADDLAGAAVKANKQAMGGDLSKTLAVREATGILLELIAGRTSTRCTCDAPQTAGLTSCIPTKLLGVEVLREAKVPHSGWRRKKVRVQQVARPTQLTSSIPTRCRKSRLWRQSSTRSDWRGLSNTWANTNGCCGAT
jgi:hypothetical protein